MPWPKVSLGSVLTRSPQKVMPTAEPHLPFVGLDSIAPNTMTITTTVPFGTMKSAGSRFRAGDVLYSRLRPYLNKVWHADRDGACSGELLVLRTHECLDPRYLTYCLHGREFVEFASHAVTGDRPRLDANQLASFQIALPSLDTQRRIVTRIGELFSDLDDGEEELARARTDLATYRKALLKAAVTGELTADWRAAQGEHRQVIQDSVRALTSESVQDLPALPSTWTWVALGEIGRVSGGLTKNAKRVELPKKVPYLRVGNVGAGSFDLARLEQIGVVPAELQRTLLRRGDLLIVEGNGSIDQIGRSAVWHGEVEPCAHQNHLIKVRFADEQIAHWLQLWLQSPFGRRELERQASSTSGLHTLSIRKVASARCPLPPILEMQRVLEIAADALAEGSLLQGGHEEVKTASTTLRQSILSAAFRGELM